MRAIVSTHRPELDRILVDLAAAATGQQLQRTCGHFTTSDAEPLVDTWAARDVGMCELKAGMSELRVVLPTADAIAAHDRIDRRAQQLWREQHAAAQAAAAAAAASDEPDGCGDAAASPDAAASLSPDPVGCLRADAFLEAVDASMPVCRRTLRGGTGTWWSCTPPSRRWRNRRPPTTLTGRSVTCVTNVVPRP